MPTQRRGSSPRGRQSEDRLLDAVTSVVGSHGYAHLTVEAVLGAAAVSRATFYQYFSNVEDCFASAYRLHAEQLVAQIVSAVRGTDQREFAMLDVLVDTAIAQPQVARLLLTEGLAAGPVGLRERDVLTHRIADAIAGETPQKDAVDLPPGLLIGGAIRFLSMGLADGEVRTDLRNELREWASAFVRRSSQPSWSARLAPTPSRNESRAPSTANSLRPTGTPRQRILQATAATVREKGYRDVTVADIVAAAGVSRRTLYNEFPSKADAFMATYEHGFEQAIAACAPAFFARRSWPERVWHAAQAFNRFLLREPLIAYLGFVQCYAVGPRFTRRVHDTQLAFTMFLEDGYRQRREAQSLSRACSSLTASTIFEAGFQRLRCGPSLQVRQLQPLAVYIALAPFIGRDEAGAFLMTKLSATGY
jgi:AcrR family transcriptional regulator